MPKAIGFVARLYDVAMMCEPIKQGRGHLGINKNSRPLGEREVGGNHHAGLLVELGEQVKQQRAPGLTKRQIPQLVKDDQIDARKRLRDTAGRAFAPSLDVLASPIR